MGRNERKTTFTNSHVLRKLTKGWCHMTKSVSGENDKESPFNKRSLQVVIFTRNRKISQEKQ